MTVCVTDGAQAFVYNHQSGLEISRTSCEWNRDAWRLPLRLETFQLSPQLLHIGDNELRYFVHRSGKKGRHSQPVSVLLYDPLVLILATEERFCFGSFTLVRACASAAAPYLNSSSAVLVKMLRVSSKKEHCKLCGERDSLHQANCELLISDS